MDVIKLDQLPDLCLRKIFEFLNLRDRVECRSVCHLFKFYVDETTVDQLVVKNLSSYSYRYSCSDNWGRCTVWYLTNREIDFNNSISEAAFSSMRSLKLNQRLRFLHVHLGYYARDFYFNLFNGLNHLVHLELRITLNDTPKTLALPNLKVFDVWNSYLGSSCFLNTPKLEVLAYGKSERIQVEHPETIKRLACSCLTDPVAKFKNLEVLTFRRADYQLRPISLSLSDWKHLKELNLPYAQYERYMSWVVGIMRQRADLKRDELKLYLGEVLVDENQLLRSIMASSENFMLKNHQFLRRHTYPDVRKLQFDRLMELDVELSTDFFHRFPSIQELTASGPVEPHSLEWFLENATELRALTLSGTLLDQAFMERLPNVASRLERLKVWSEGSRLITDFHFILRLKQLRIFETDHQFDSLELVAQAYQQLKELRSFKFPVGREKVEIGIPYRYESLQANKERSEETPRKDEYTLFIRKENGTRKLDRGCVKWAKLVALYDQNKAQQAGGHIQTRAKRARLR